MTDGDGVLGMPSIAPAYLVLMERRKRKKEKAMSEEETKKKYYVTLSYLAHVTLDMEAKDPDEAGRLALHKSDRGDIKVEDFRDDDGLWETVEVEEVYDPDTAESRRSIFYGQPPEGPDKMRREYKLKYGVSGFLTAARIREVVYEDDDGNVSTGIPVFETTVQTDVDEAVVRAVRESGKFRRDGNKIVAVKYDILQVPKANDSHVYVNVQGITGVELNNRTVLVLSKKQLSKFVSINNNGTVEEFRLSGSIPSGRLSDGAFNFASYHAVMADSFVLPLCLFRTGEDFQKACRGIDFNDYPFAGEYVSVMTGEPVK